MLYRRRDIKRLFAYSSIEHMGIITFAFGMGGPLANFAGLLHMTMHSLTKSAIFFAVGHIAQAKGTQKIADLRGLTVTHPALGWGLIIGVLAIAGLPPLGIFMSEFLVDQPWRVNRFWRCRWRWACWSASERCSCVWANWLSENPMEKQSRSGRRRHPFSGTWRWCSWPASICRPRSSPGSKASPVCWAERRRRGT
jgi:hypothetical protein